MIDRTYMSAHVGRQQREREIRTTTAPIRERVPLSHRLESLAVIAFLAIPFGGYCFGTTGAVVTALLLIAGAVTEWVLARRPL